MLLSKIGLFNIVLSYLLEEWLLCKSKIHLWSVRIQVKEHHTGLKLLTQPAL